MLVLHHGDGTSTIQRVATATFHEYLTEILTQSRKIESSVTVRQDATAVLECAALPKDLSQYRVETKTGFATGRRDGLLYALPAIRVEQETPEGLVHEYEIITGLTENQIAALLKNINL